MTWYRIPYMANNATGRTVQRLIRDTGNVTLGTTTVSDQETRVPNSGDLVALQLVLTAQLTGAPSAATTIDNGIALLNFRDAGSTTIFNGVTGNTLYNVWERFLNIGRTKTIPTAATSSTTARFLIPINVEQDFLPGLIQPVFNTLASLSGGGSSAGTARLQIFGIYAADGSATGRTYRYDVVNVGARLSGAGQFNIPEVLPTDYDIEHLFHIAGTEANFTSIQISRDGAEEINDVTLDYLTGVEEATLVSGHLTNFIDFNVGPFRANSRSVFRYVMSAGDTSARLCIAKYSERSR